MKLAILYQAPPSFLHALSCPPPSLRLNRRLVRYNLFLSSPTIKCRCVSLSQTAQGFDHAILGSEGGQGFLILAGCSWQDFTHLSLLEVVFATVSPYVGVIFSA